MRVISLRRTQSHCNVSECICPDISSGCDRCLCPLLEKKFKVSCGCCRKNIGACPCTSSIGKGDEGTSDQAAAMNWGKGCGRERIGSPGCNNTICLETVSYPRTTVDRIDRCCPYKLADDNYCRI